MHVANEAHDTLVRRGAQLIVVGPRGISPKRHILHTGAYALILRNRLRGTGTLRCSEIALELLRRRPSMYHVPSTRPAAAVVAILHVQLIVSHSEQVSNIHRILYCYPYNSSSAYYWRVQ